MARGSNRALRVGAAAAVILVSGIGGCAEIPPAGPLDVGETHRIEAVATRFELATRFEPGHSHLSYADNLRLNRFLRMFHSRARTDLVVATTPDAEGLKAQEHMAAFRERLVAEGVSRHRIAVRPGMAPLAGAVHEPVPHPAGGHRSGGARAARPPADTRARPRP